MAVTFDNWFTQPNFCHFLDQTLHLPYLGTLAETGEIILQTGNTISKDSAAHLKTEHLEVTKKRGKAVFRNLTVHYKGSTETYFSYCRTHFIHNLGKQCLVIKHRQEHL